MKRIILLLVIELGALSANCGTFNSLANGQFNNAATWTLTSGTDADGIPDADDDVTILNGHTVTLSSLSTTNSIVQGVTIQTGATLTVSSPRTLTIWGNYQNDGTESGNGIIIFNNGIGTTISGSGTFSSTLRFHFNVGANRTIAAGTTITKTASTLVIVSATVTNLGTYTVFNTNITGTGNFINGATGILNIRTGSSFSGGTLNASTPGNSVFLQYYSLYVVNPSGGIYHHLNINGTGALYLNSNITVNGNFTISGGNGFHQNNFDLSVGGNFFKQGFYTPSATGEIVLNGTAAQTLSCLGTTTQFGHIRIDNPTTVTLTTPGVIQVLYSLTVTQGTFNLGNESVTLISNAATTAYIGPTSGTFTNGNLIIQRYIDARSAGYSDMAGSFVGQTLASWDDELLLVYAYSPPNYYPSVFGYDETSWDYVPVTSSTQALDPGVGFEVYLDSDGGQTTFNATTLSHTGMPTTGDVDMSGYITFNNDGWNLLGNPYHAHLDWDALHATTTGIAADIMFYDETIADFTTVTGGSGATIAPNQGFWVQATSGSPSFTFTESVKSTSTSSTFRKKESPFFTLRSRAESTTDFTSGTQFRFDGKGTLNFKKVPHPIAPSFYSLSPEGKPLKLNSLDVSQEEIAVAMAFKPGADDFYTIEAEALNALEAEGYTCVILEDTKLGEKTDLTTTKYRFFAEAGKEENRFILHLSKDGNCKSAQDILAGNTIENVNITQVAGNPVVRFEFDKPTSVNISVVDLLGQELVPSQLLIGTNQEVTLGIPADFSGVYLINVTYNNQQQSRKLFR